MPSVQQELREILEAVEERGFTPKNTDGHFKIYYGDRPVMFKPNPDEDLQVPVTIPGTPSDARWRDNLIATLIKARVLDDDPKKAGQRGLTAEDEERREAEREARKVRAEAEAQRRADQSSDDRSTAEIGAELWERCERVLGRLGTWREPPPGHGTRGEARRTPGEAARVAYLWAVENDVEPRPASVNAAEVAMGKFYKSRTMGGRTAQWLNAFLDAVEAADDPAEFYFGLLRDLLGLTLPGEEPVAAVEPEPEPEPTPGPEPLKTEAEDDLRIRDLREALEASRREADKARREAVERVQEAEEEARKQAIMRAEVEGMLEDARKAVTTNGAEPRIPEIAFEALGEMIGTYISVGAEEDINAVLTLQTQKKEKAVMLAKKIARMELGIAQEDE